MKRSNLILAALCLGIGLILFLSTRATGQDKKAAPPPRVEGTIAVISKDTITVQTKNGRVQVLYNAKTQYTFRNKPATMDELKEGRRAICLVTANEKNQMVATRVDLREK